MRKFLLGLVCGLLVVGVANMGHASLSGLFGGSGGSGKGGKAAAEPDLVRYKGLIMTMALCNTSKTFLNAQPKAAMVRFLANPILIRTATDCTEEVD